MIFCLPSHRYRCMCPLFVEYNVDNLFGSKWKARRIEHPPSHETPDSLPAFRHDENYPPVQTIVERAPRCVGATTFKMQQILLLSRTLSKLPQVERTPAHVCHTKSAVFFSRNAWLMAIAALLIHASCSFTHFLLAFLVLASWSATLRNISISLTPVIAKS